MPGMPGHVRKVEILAPSNVSSLKPLNSVLRTPPSAPLAKRARSVEINSRPARAAPTPTQDVRRTLKPSKAAALSTRHLPYHGEMRLSERLDSFVRMFDVLSPLPTSQSPRRYLNWDASVVRCPPSALATPKPVTALVKLPLCTHSGNLRLGYADSTVT